jgi:hypothetical protein
MGFTPAAAAHKAASALRSLLPLVAGSAAAVTAY